MNLAPIVLFAYNRPDHTKLALDSLVKNKGANQSTLYVFADGPKNNEHQELALVREVRQIIRNYNEFKHVEVFESVQNKGLASSIIEGVTQIINLHEKVIVLEDDIVTSPGFITFMNDALDIYKDDDEVMHISGYMFPVKGKLPKTFFFNSASCWGWATWNRAWEKLIKNPRMLLEKIDERGAISTFNLDGAYNYREELVANITGKKKTWAVLWYGSIFLEQGYCLHPYPSLTSNIGNDGSGINSRKTSMYTWSRLPERIVVEKIPIEESGKARRLVKDFYQRGRKTNLIEKLKSSLIRLFSEGTIEKLGTLINSEKRRQYLEIQRILKIPRYSAFPTTIIKGNLLECPDSASLVFSYREIFLRKCYDFKFDDDDLFIIDGGANVGLAIFFWKNRYPNAKVVAFEADPEIFQFLEKNVQRNSLKNVTLVNKALWSSNTVLNFQEEGADAGRVIADSGSRRIEGVRLSEYISRTVHYLKLDIEGAELEVLEEIKGKLHLVERIFIEYHSFAGQSQHLDRILFILGEADFRYYVNSPGVSQHNPFTGMSLYNGMDMQLNIYGIRQ